jgi:hypothetical protein
VRQGHGLVACAITRSRAGLRKHATAGHQCVAAASCRPPRACHCPSSLSIASLPIGSCPTAPLSRRVDSSSRIPPAELPEPPLTGKHELRVRGSRPLHRFPAPINSPASLAALPRTSQALPSLSPELPPPPSTSRPCYRPPAAVDLLPQAAPAQGENRNESPSTSSLRSPHSRPPPCPGWPPSAAGRSPLCAPFSVSILYREEEEGHFAHNPLLYFLFYPKPSHFLSLTHSFIRSP